MVQTPLGVIEDEILATRQGIEECETQILAYQQEIAVAQQKLAILVALREKIDLTVEQPSVPGSRSDGSPAKRLGASEGIVSLLRREGSLLPSQIVEALENRVTTKSKHKRRLISQTLVNLVKRGMLVREGNKYKLAKLDNE